MTDLIVDFKYNQWVIELEGFHQGQDSITGDKIRLHIQTLQCFVNFQHFCKRLERVYIKISNTIGDIAENHTLNKICCSLPWQELFANAWRIKLLYRMLILEFNTSLRLPIQWNSRFQDRLCSYHFHIPVIAFNNFYLGK